MAVKCVVCGLAMPGWPDADVTCTDCEFQNFSGDALRHPPRRAPHQPWWQGVERIIPPQHTDGLRALRFVQGRWTWLPENGIEESELADLIPFAYHNYSIRTMQHDDGTTWWVASDVCAALELGNISRACARLKDNEKGITSSNTLGGEQEILIVSEPGLYRLIMRSRKKEAEHFQHWVFHDVLPQIRKTGSFGQPATPAVINPEHQLMIDMIVRIDQTEQRALRAEADAAHAQIAAARAEGKADLALADARTMTLEEFVLSNWLLRQMPEAQWPTYTRWLKEVCLALGHDIDKGKVLGKRWQLENVYPLQALCALKHHEATKPHQMAMVRPIDQGGA